MSSDFRSDPEYEAKTDDELFALADDSVGLWDQSRAVAVLGRRAATNERALRRVVEVARSDRGRLSVLGVELRWYAIVGLAVADADDTRAAVADVMSAWPEDERDACREFLVMAADVELRPRRRPQSPRVA